MAGERLDYFFCDMRINVQSNKEMNYVNNFLYMLDYTRVLTLASLAFIFTLKYPRLVEKFVGCTTVVGNSTMRCDRAK